MGDRCRTKARGEQTGKDGRSRVIVEVQYETLEGCSIFNG